MSSTFTGVPVLAMDDNLANGRTYTFQFKCANWFCLTDLSTTLQNDLMQQAPDFIQNISVTSPPTTSLYNVQFTYEGDGSDVVLDLGNLFIATFKAISGDDLTFIGAVSASAPEIVVSPATAAQTVEKSVTSAVSTVSQDAVQAATDTVNKALTGLLPLLIVVVLLILFVVPSFVKSTGVKLQAG